MSFYFLRNLTHKPGSFPSAGTFMFLLLVRLFFSMFKPFYVFGAIGLLGD